MTEENLYWILYRDAVGPGLLYFTPTGWVEIPRLAWKGTYAEAKEKVRYYGWDRTNGHTIEPVRKEAVTNG